MKKCFIIIGFAVVFVVVVCSVSVSITDLFNNSNAIYEITSTRDDLINDCNYNLGDTYLYQLDNAIAVKDYENDVETQGVAIKLNSNEFSIEEITRKLALIVNRRQVIENKNIIYGYSKSVKFDAVNGSNVQIVYSNDCIIVGFPLIYGSY